MKDWKRQLEQIEGNWGRFEPVMTQPAGQGATVEYRFRNGTAVELEAHEIKVAQAPGRREGLHQDPAPADWTGRRSTSATWAIAW